MKVLIDIPEEEYLIIKTKIITGDDGYLDRAVADGIQIPDNATNGDVIKAIFPNGTTAKFATFMRFIDGEHYFNCSDEWWNAPYQKGGKE